MKLAGLGLLVQVKGGLDLAEKLLKDPKLSQNKQACADLNNMKLLFNYLLFFQITDKIVKSTKFLGVHLADNLTWSLNTSSITKKSPAASLLPEKAEESPPPSPHPDHVLQRDH
ncbi:hypothetical protein HF521_001647 [Silurus meridionalis]|uniref:Uncharacterized protein n=1 Tax=Silurus meridionalis TaxID=175797 RepID=A0A8T0BBH1_SILME|nr:hypothetical protein HF521_001647 [Silurus meridionalis]